MNKILHLTFLEFDIRIRIRSPSSLITIQYYWRIAMSALQLGTIQILRNALGGEGVTYFVTFCYVDRRGGGPFVTYKLQIAKRLNFKKHNFFVISISLALVLFQETTYSSVLTFLKTPYLSIQIDSNHTDPTPIPQPHPLYIYLQHHPKWVQKIDHFMFS